MIFRVASAHEEGGEREYAINTECFLGDEDGNVAALRAHRVEQKIVDGRMVFEKIEGSEQEFPADLVLLSMGFVGPERGALLDGLGVELDRAGQRRARRGAGAPTSTACSCAATWAAASRSSCGRSPRVVPAPPRSTRRCRARRLLPGPARAHHRPAPLDPEPLLSRARRHGRAGHALWAPWSSTSRPRLRRCVLRVDGMPDCRSRSTGLRHPMRCWARASSASVTT